mmetsp:Transcript_12410/g.27240  ORF Transcript_12410/g.27240 Transcript_12410/m.27240 type:complete len:83 (+) Transcript_12410:432-680(+)
MAGRDPRPNGPPTDSRCAEQTPRLAKTTTAPGGSLLSATLRADLSRGRAEGRTPSAHEQLRRLTATDLVVNPQEQATRGPHR